MKITHENKTKLKPKIQPWIYNKQTNMQYIITNKPAAYYSRHLNKTKKKLKQKLLLEVFHWIGTDLVIGCAKVFVFILVFLFVVVVTKLTNGQI